MSRRSAREREFEEFALACTPALYRSAWLLCGNRQAAEDLVQETLAKMYAKWHQPFGRIDNPTAYAHTTLTRTFLSGARKRSFRDERLFADLPETSLDDTTEPVAARLTIRQALEELSSIDQAVVVSRYLDDLSVAETARRLGISPGAVKTRSMRALQRLRGLVEPAQDVADPASLLRRDPPVPLCEGAEHA